MTDRTIVLDSVFWQRGRSTSGFEDTGERYLEASPDASAIFCIPLAVQTVCPERVRDSRAAFIMLYRL